MEVVEYHRIGRGGFGIVGEAGSCLEGLEGDSFVYVAADLEGHRL